MLQHNDTLEIGSSSKIFRIEVKENNTKTRSRKDRKRKLHPTPESAKKQKLDTSSSDFSQDSVDVLETQPELSEEHLGDFIDAIQKDIDLTGYVKKLEEEAKELDGKCTKYKMNIAALESNLESEKKKFDEYTTQWHAKEKQLNEKIESLTKENQKLKEHVEHLEKSLIKAKGSHGTNISAFKQREQQLLAMIDSLKEERNKLSMCYEDKVTQCRMTLSDKEFLEREVEQLKLQISALRETIQERNNEIEQLKMEHATTNLEIEALLLENGELSDECDRMRNQIQAFKRLKASELKLQQKLNSRNMLVNQLRDKLCRMGKLFDKVCLESLSYRTKIMQILDEKNKQILSLQQSSKKLSNYNVQVSKQPNFSSTSSQYMYSNNVPLFRASKGMNTSQTSSQREFMGTQV